MQSKAKTVAEYLAELPADRRAAIEAVRRVLLQNVDEKYEEGMLYGMMGYYVPHRIYPAGYHCDPKQPLPYVGLASQKNYMSLYLMCSYGDGDYWKWFQQAWAKTGKKLNMGKSCLRFKKVEDLALDVIAEALQRTPVKKYIEDYESTIKDNLKRASKGPAKRGKPAKATKLTGSAKSPRKKVRHAR